MDKVRTSPYHPQCDGLVESLNKTIIDMLAKYCSKNSRDWDLWLQVLDTEPWWFVEIHPLEVERAIKCL